ncbi:hypothetical protein [Parafrigoribacterium humi]|uniref:hypothetical protein n=1 Tax=Parafrigoribacterium humi TaxID=3144664 RepID=UPI0032F009C1
MALSAHSFTMRAAAVATIGALALFGLAGCKAETDTQSSSTTHSPRATSPSSASATPNAVASPTTAPAPTRAPGTPVGVACASFLTPQVVYDFNPNTSLQPAYKPAAGSDGATALSFKGISCGLVNDSSGVVTSVSIAHPGASDLTALKSAAARGAATSGLGDAAYFSTNGQVGQLQVFMGPYWISTSSVFFGTADDARGLVTAALSAVK